MSVIVTAPLTILGKTLDGEMLCFGRGPLEAGVTAPRLAALRRLIGNPERVGIVNVDGLTVDESDVDVLIEAMARIDDLPFWPVEPCRWCRSESVAVIENRPYCAGHAAAWATAEAVSS